MRWRARTCSRCCRRAAASRSASSCRRWRGTGLTVVVSPLIALMKDQVDALQASGVPATFLNSSLAAGESRARLRGLHNGQYRLLYVAPERLMLSGFLADLQRWNVNLLAVDEAHCISEWGHDFRPEYRQLAELRELFPDGADHGADRHGHRARARGHRHAAEAARAELLRRQLQPPEPDLPRLRQEQALRAGAGVSARRGPGKAASSIASRARPPRASPSG